ncbi:MAG: VOC family protein [Bernardetiaceae bacterium]|jgi:catechol 2,3-dioxygenase-like lactoylglutathione lyase family enzyme|nr:VOC family protein [Bernardetiaceae bacterium]
MTSPLPLAGLALNHVALHVADVAASVRFYGQVLGLAALPRPDFDFPGAWFALGAGHELHLIGGRAAPAQSHSRGTHFALQVADVRAAEAALRARGATCSPLKPRPDGVLQFFVTDPDGHWIEFCQAAG